jgi:hypothetical protein
MIAIDIARKATADFLGGIAAFIDPTNPDNIPRKVPKIEHFEHPDGNYIEIFVESKGITKHEVSVSRRDEFVSITLVPDFADGVVLHPESPRNTLVSNEDALERFEKFGHLTWSRSTALQISQYIRFCLDHAKPTDEDFWLNRAGSMATALTEALVALRDFGSERLSADTFRNHHHLDAFVALSLDDRLPDRATEKLKLYLEHLPGYSKEDALAGSLSPKCYQVHGHVTMLLMNTNVFYSQSESINRPVRPVIERYTHEIKVPFKKVTYTIVPEGLVVTVQYHPVTELVGMKD